MTASGCHGLNILHVIHDFLPRHEAGSEIYAFELCRELARRHHVKLLCAEYDPVRHHGEVTWRVYRDLPVIEVVNNWVCRSFEDTYRAPAIRDQIVRVLDAVQPDVLHVHNLLNLSLDLPAVAHAAGIPMVATLHDYTLVCPSGGQRIHRAEQHVCRVIDTERCARCFAQSPFYPQMSFGAVAAATGAPPWVRQAAQALARRFPWLAGRIARTAHHAALPAITAVDIDRRLAAARAACDEVDLFVAPSRSIAEEFVRFGVDASKLRVSNLGFVPLVATGRRATGGPLRIGYVGTLVWHKGVHVLVDAVRRLPADTYELKIFGDPAVAPDYSANLRARATGLPIRLMGPFGREQTAEVYSQIDVLVVPSLWMENSPLVIREAFMAGVPVVGARMGGIGELVIDGENGLLYEATSIADLEAILRGLAGHPERLEALRQRMPPVKSIEQDAREWEGAYLEVLERRAVGAAG